MLELLHGDESLFKTQSVDTPSDRLCRRMEKSEIESGSCRGDHYYQNGKRDPQTKLNAAEPQDESRQDKDDQTRHKRTAQRLEPTFFCYTRIILLEYLISHDLTPFPSFFYSDNLLDRALNEYFHYYISFFD
jgi:hypothetical protein